MIDRDKVTRAFADVTPSDEIVEAILQARFGRRKRLHACKAAATAVCACLLLSMSALGVAAAAGIVDFREVFGEYIDMIGFDHGEALLGQATDITTTISDEDYELAVKAVTGDTNSLYAVIELSRRDGTPVTAHFRNPSPEDPKAIEWMYTTVTMDNAGGGWDHRINEQGNIEYILNVTGDDLNGYTFRVVGENLVLMEAFYQYCDANHVWYDGFYDEEDGWSQCWRSADDMEALPGFVCDDSSFLLLPVRWELSFTYQSAPLTARPLRCRHPKQTTMYYETTADYEITMEHIEVSPSGAEIVFTHEEVPVSGDAALPMPDYQRNEVYLTMADGSQRPMQLKRTSCRSVGEIGATYTVEQTIDLVFLGEQDKTVSYVDISDARSITFNGVTYKLK